MKVSGKNLIKGALVVGFLSYLALFWWDQRKVDNFCQAIDIGLKVDYLPALAEKYGVELQKLAGLASGKAKSIIYAIAPKTGAKRICSIEHDFKYVLSRAVLK